MHFSVALTIPTLAASAELGGLVESFREAQPNKLVVSGGDSFEAATFNPPPSGNIHDTTTGQSEFIRYALKQTGGVTIGFVEATDETSSLVSPMVFQTSSPATSRARSIARPTSSAPITRPMLRRMS